MCLSVKVLIIAAPLLSSFLSTIVTASPVEIYEDLAEAIPASTWVSTSVTPAPPRPPWASTSIASPPLGPRPPAAVTCYHEADPGNSCPAIADSPGYCACNNDGSTYEIMGPTNPCAWTTIPATTSFDCNAPAPAPPAPTPLACTLYDKPVGQGRAEVLTQSCKCNDGSSPTPTTSDGQYACPAQVTNIILKRDNDGVSSSELIPNPISSPPPSPQPPAPPPAPLPVTLNCTLTDEVIAGGRVPLITHKCSCNDGSKPTPVISDDEYVCPAQVSVVVHKRSEYNKIELGGFI